MFKVLPSAIMVFTLLLMPKAFAAAEDEQNEAAVLAIPRLLSATETAALEGLFDLDSQPVPLPTMHAAEYFAKDMDEDTFLGVLARIKGIHIPHGEETDTLNVYFAWLQGPGKDVVAGSETDPLKGIEEVSKGWTAETAKASFQTLLYISDADVLAFAIAAGSNISDDNDEAEENPLPRSRDSSDEDDGSNNDFQGKGLGSSSDDEDEDYEGLPSPPGQDPINNIF